MEIVIINGRPGVGKDAFVETVKSLIGEFRCYHYSTVDFVKFVATCAGWRGEKTAENRLFLSDLKKLLSDWNDVPYKKTKTEIADCMSIAAGNGCLGESVMFIHCREPEEIDRLKKDFDAHTLLVKRAAAEIVISNPSDGNVFNYDYDVIIENNGDLDELRESARTYITEILGLTI